MSRRSRSQSVLVAHRTSTRLIGAVGRASVGFGLAVGRSRAIRPTVNLSDVNSAALRPPTNFWREPVVDELVATGVAPDTGGVGAVRAATATTTTAIQTTTAPSPVRRATAARPTWTDQVLQRSAIGYTPAARRTVEEAPPVPDDFEPSGDAKLDRLRLMLRSQEAPKRTSSTRPPAASTPSVRRSPRTDAVGGQPGEPEHAPGRRGDTAAGRATGPGRLATSMRPESVTPSNPAGLAATPAPGGNVAAPRPIGDGSQRPPRSGRRAAAPKAPSKMDTLRQLLVEQGLLTDDTDADDDSPSGRARPRPDAPKASDAPGSLPAADAGRGTTSTSRALRDAVRRSTPSTTSTTSTAPTGDGPASASTGVAPDTNAGAPPAAGPPTVRSSHDTTAVARRSAANSVRVARMRSSGFAPLDTAAAGSVLETSSPDLASSVPTAAVVAPPVPSVPLVRAARPRLPWSDATPELPPVNGRTPTALRRVTLPRALSSTHRPTTSFAVPSGIAPNPPVTSSSAPTTATATSGATRPTSTTAPAAASPASTTSMTVPAPITPMTVPAPITPTTTTAASPTPGAIDAAGSVAPSGGLAVERAAVGAAPRSVRSSLADTVAPPATVVRQRSAPDDRADPLRPRRRSSSEQPDTAVGRSRPTRSTTSVLPAGVGALHDIVRRNAVGAAASPPASKPTLHAPDAAGVSSAEAPARNGVDATEPIGSVAAPRPSERLAEQFMTELSQTVRRSSAPLPMPFRPMADEITGGRRVMLSTDGASRRALRRVGKVAATTGDTIHLDRAAIPQRRVDEVVAHELTHVAHPSPTPRFFDDVDDSPEERRAEQVASIMARSPLAPSAPVAAPRSPSPSPSPSGSTETVRRSPAAAPTGGGVSADALAARLGGSGTSTSAAGTIRRFGGSSSSSSWQPARPSSSSSSSSWQPAAPSSSGASGASMLGSGRSAPPSAPPPAPPTAAAPAAPPSAPPAAPSSASPARPGFAFANEDHAEAWFRTQVRENLPLLLRLVEDQMIIELERRGGRSWGGL